MRAKPPTPARLDRVAAARRHDPRLVMIFQKVHHAEMLRARVTGELGFNLSLRVERGRDGRGEAD